MGFMKGRKTNKAKVLAMKEEGVSINAIAARLGTSKYNVCKILLETGLIEKNPYNNSKEGFNDLWYGSLHDGLTKENQDIIKGAWI